MMFLLCPSMFPLAFVALVPSCAGPTPSLTSSPALKQRMLRTCAWFEEDNDGSNACSEQLYRSDECFSELSSLQRDPSILLLPSYQTISLESSLLYLCCPRRRSLQPDSYCVGETNYSQHIGPLKTSFSVTAVMLLQKCIGMDLG